MRRTTRIIFTRIKNTGWVYFIFNVFVVNHEKYTFSSNFKEYFSDPRAKDFVNQVATVSLTCSNSIELLCSYSSLSLKLTLALQNPISSAWIK